jgi:branched-subunit amino acid transport protein AzlD
MEAGFISKVAFPAFPSVHVPRIFSWRRFALALGVLGLLVVSFIKQRKSVTTYFSLQLLAAEAFTSIKEGKEKGMAKLPAKAYLFCLKHFVSMLISGNR